MRKKIQHRTTHKSAVSFEFRHDRRFDIDSLSYGNKKVIGGGGSLSKSYWGRGESVQKESRSEGYLQSTENISLRVARPETQWERDVRNVGHTTVVYSPSLHSSHLMTTNSVCFHRWMWWNTHASRCFLACHIQTAIPRNYNTSEKFFLLYCLTLLSPLQNFAAPLSNRMEVNEDLKRLGWYGKRS